MLNFPSARSGVVAVVVIVAVAVVLPAAASSATSQPVAANQGSPATASQSLGKPHRGTLIHGALFPATGPHHITWDPATQSAPAPDWRHWANAETLRRTACVIDALAADHPDWPRLLVGDMSLAQGGPFGREYGGLGHASHQNGLDVDVYYPRKDRTERAASTRTEVDFDRAQEIVNRFVAAGADRVFVGRTTPLRPSLPVVQRLRGHADHLHVRFPDPNRPPAAIMAPAVEAPNSNPPPVASTYPDCGAAG